MYLVVYGNEWEDICYFTNIDKAKTKLVTLTIGMLKQTYPMYFLPMLYELTEDNGVLHKSQHYWYLDYNDYDKIQEPSEAFPFIKMS